MVQNTTQEWTTEETAGRKTSYKTEKCHFLKTFSCALTGSRNNGRPKVRWNVQISVWIEDRYKDRIGETSRKEAILKTESDIII